MTAEELAGWTARSRAAQGLPPKITDSAILARVVTLTFTGSDGIEGGGDRARSA
jgi:hypothetical protein